MKKENILSKLNIKDYNNELEKILAKKDFSMDTKNLLLSMSYKIENAYKDYMKVKQEVLSKNKYLEKLIAVINSKCYEFTTIKPSMPEFEDLKDTKFIIDSEKGKITVIENEYYALKAITELPRREWCILDEYGLLKEPFCKTLTLGSIMHETEVLRDFNGWAWNTNVGSIEDVKCNLIYQCLIYLFGNQFLTEWIENTQEMVDYIALAQNKLEKDYGKELAKDVITQICKIVMEYGINDEIIEKRNYLKEELELLNDRESYLESATIQKKKYRNEIDKVDKILNNKDLLKEEYIKRNSLLENKDKIFSIKRLKIILEEEREELLRKIKEANGLIDPKKYIIRKSNVEKDYNFLADLKVDGIDSGKLINLCKSVLKTFKIRVEMAQTREELLTLVYEVRYFRYLYFDNEKTLKEIKELSIPFYKVMIKLLKKLIDFKWADTICTIPKANLKSLIRIFNSKIIDLDNLVIETEYTKDGIKVQYYDTNVLENEFLVEISKDVDTKKLKLKKKIKVFN